MINIKERRKELGLTICDVAKFVGVSDSTVSRWETGNIANMKRSRVIALAKILKIDPLEIIGAVEINDEFDALEKEIMGLLKSISGTKKAMLLAYAKFLTVEDGENETASTKEK